MSNDNQNGEQPQQPGGQTPQPGGAAPQPGAGGAPGSAAPQPGAGWQQPPAAPPGQPPYGGYPQGQPQGSNADPGFFSALFDLSFRNYVTLKFAKVIFVILIVLAALGWLTAIIVGFAAEPIIGILALLFGWIGPFIALVIYRVVLEAAVALIRTAQNTSILVDRR